MKRFLTLCLIVLAVSLALHGCGRDDGGNIENDENFGLVFVNGSDSTIVAVVADFEDQFSVAQRADSSPLKKGETFGFEAGTYPVTVTVYDRPVGDFEQGVLGSVTIQEAPPEGEQWYITAYDGENGLTFTVDTSWPKGVQAVG